MVLYGNSWKLRITYANAYAPTALAVGTTFPSRDVAKDALLRHTVARGESYITHK
jgi:hypothetical protein